MLKYLILSIKKMETNSKSDSTFVEKKTTLNSKE